MVRIREGGLFLTKRGYREIGWYFDLTTSQSPATFKFFYQSTLVEKKGKEFEVARFEMEPQEWVLPIKVEGQTSNYTEKTERGDTRNIPSATRDKIAFSIQALKR